MPAGRPIGSLSHSTKEQIEFAKRIMDGPEYEASVKTRLLAGLLPPNIEALLWYYRFGRPTDTVEVAVKRDDFREMPLGDLAARAQALAAVLTTTGPEEESSTATARPVPTVN